MKRTRLSLLLIGLLTAGCTPLWKETKPEQPKKTVAAKPTTDQVPAAVAKLLPPDQLNDKNARDQAQLLEDTLKKEQGEMQPVASAKRD